MQSYLNNFFLYFSLIYLTVLLTYGPPRWHSGKELPANARDARDSGSIPRLRKSP